MVLAQTYKGKNERINNKKTSYRERKSTEQSIHNKIYKNAPEARHATRRNGTMATTGSRFEAYDTVLSNPSFFYARGVLESGSTRTPQQKRPL